MINKACFSFRTIKNDIFSGLIIALVSIPISMGYAQIAGLPAVYGLYGSLLPILVYGLCSSSPQFIVGVDAMPAAMVGATLAEFGIISGSAEALSVVPAISVLVALWFVIFRTARAGRMVKYISNPVMGGFISGVGLTIILMQIPKLFGGNPGVGEVIVLIPHIIRELQSFNWVSCVLGVGTVVIILVSKKLFPKFPMTVALLGVGIILAAVFHIEKFDVKLLPAVEPGLPKLIIPALPSLLPHLREYVVLSLTVALVIMAQTLLAANNYAASNNYTLNADQELIAYAAMNIVGSLTGSCPINGSVSRTGIGAQFSGKTQLMSITASITMLIVILFLTPFFIYLPVPILTGIVISALIGILDSKQAKRLWQCNRFEFCIFMVALLGVLFLGTIYGVVIGVFLSFVQVVKKAVIPPRIFLGKIPGQHGYYNLKRNKNAVAVKDTVIYRFGGNLFFANVGTFQNDILSAVLPTTKQVVVDASGIGDIDITAADRLISIADTLESRGVRFYFTEHQGHINDQLRTYGAEKLLENGNVRRTMSLALQSCGYKKPYQLEGDIPNVIHNQIENNEVLAEFEWLFGTDAEGKMNQFASEILAFISAKTPDEISQLNIENLEEKLAWGKIGLFDETELLDHLEIKLEQLAATGKFTKLQLDELELLIEKRKETVEQKVHLLNPLAIDLMHKRLAAVETHLSRLNPKEYEHIKSLKELVKKK